MTRKDFRIVADALLAAKPELGSGYSVEEFQRWKTTVYSVSDALAKDNERFKPFTFEVAAGAPGRLQR